MILNIQESMDLCDWLLEREVYLSESANILVDLQHGETFGLALKKVFKNRCEMIEKMNQQTLEWDNDFPSEK